VEKRLPKIKSGKSESLSDEIDRIFALAKEFEPIT